MLPLIDCGAPLLQELWLHSNCLALLPESFGRLAHVQELGLGNNQLEALPESFGMLARTHTHARAHMLLSLSVCSMFAFEPQLMLCNICSRRIFNRGRCCWLLVGDLKSLSILELENNCLEALPESFGKLRRLEHLTLDHNRLRVG